MECVVASYIFSCDEGKRLDRNKADQLLALNNAHFSDDNVSVRFTVYDDNDTSKAQKIRGQLFYAQIPELDPPAAK